MVGAVQAGGVVDEQRDAVAERSVVVGDAESPRVARLSAVCVARPDWQQTRHDAVRTHRTTGRQVRLTVVVALFANDAP